jgi:hypothetical protein
VRRGADAASGPLPAAKRQQASGRKLLSQACENTKSPEKCFRKLEKAKNRRKNAFASLRKQKIAGKSLSQA